MGNSNCIKFCSRFFARVAEEREIQTASNFAHDFLLQYTYTFSNHWDKLWHIVGFAAKPRIPITYMKDKDNKGLTLCKTKTKMAKNNSQGPLNILTASQSMSEW